MFEGIIPIKKSVHVLACVTNGQITKHLNKKQNKKSPKNPTKWFIDFLNSHIKLKKKLEIKLIEPTTHLLSDLSFVPISRILLIKETALNWSYLEVKLFPISLSEFYALCFQ